MTAHARLSPSAAESWMTCFGYANAVAGLPNDSSEFAAEGTAAHQISELALATGLSPFDFIGMRQKIEEWTFEWNEDDAEELAPGIDEIRGYGGRFYGEHKVNLSRWLGPDQFGTLDRGIILPDLIIINDLKWGRGVPVSPVKNKQLMIYALGFWDNIARHVSDATKFRIEIDQPRCSGGGGKWETTLEELLGFGDEAKAAAEKSNDPNAPRVASAKGCFWCRRKNAPGGCATYEEFNLDLIGMSFEDVDTAIMLNEPPTLSKGITPERRSYLLEHRKMFEGWLEDMHVSCIDDALAGRPTPGLKAVDGRRPPRKWNDPGKAELTFKPILGDGLFISKMKSPTQVEKEIGKEDFKEYDALVDTGQPKPVLVPEADARPALTPVTEKFDEVELI